MSGHNRKKKDDGRTDKESQRRQQDFQQPVLGSETPERAQDVSNLTDGETAGADWKRNDSSEGPDR